MLKLWKIYCPLLIIIAAYQNCSPKFEASGRLGTQSSLGEGGFHDYDGPGDFAPAEESKIIFTKNRGPLKILDRKLRLLSGVEFSNTIESLTGFVPPNSSNFCLLYTSPSPRDRTRSRMPSSA